MSTVTYQSSNWTSKFETRTESATAEDPLSQSSIGKQI